MPEDQERDVQETRGAAIRQRSENGKRPAPSVPRRQVAGRVPSVTDAETASAQLPRDGQASPDPHPWARLAGSYDDEPLWDELLAAIEERRAEVDAAEEPTR